MNKNELDPKVSSTLSSANMAYEILDCSDELADTAAFCEHYKVSLDQAANTLLVASRKIEPTRYAVCVVLATTRLDVNKKVSELLGAKKLSFADGETTQRLTGMMIGGVTAVGIKDLPIYVDTEVMQRDKVVMGGGNRVTKILISPQELLKLKEVQVVQGLAKTRA